MPRARNEDEPSAQVARALSAGGDRIDVVGRAPNDDRGDVEALEILAREACDAVLG